MGGEITERKEDCQFGGNLLILLNSSQSQQTLNDHICFSNLGKIMQAFVLLSRSKTDFHVQEIIIKRFLKS